MTKNTQIPIEITSMNHAEITQLWYHPPQDLTTLADVVIQASMQVVDADSNEDEAREYLCKIAAVRFAQYFLKNKKVSSITEKRISRHIRLIRSSDGDATDAMALADALEAANEKLAAVKACIATWTPGSALPEHENEYAKEIRTILSR